MAVCGDCHTPRVADGSFDDSRLLAGVDCLVDLDDSDADFGCLGAPNLTNDETGLKNRTDREIKDMFLKGERPADSGSRPDALHPIMPYWVFGNISDTDANAIVAYLRTLPAVEHRVNARQEPFGVEAPALRFPEPMIPVPGADYPERAAALRGRYLAGNIGVCMECHTARDATGAVEVNKAFQGGQTFARDDLGLPPVFPATIYAANITPDRTGIQGWSVQEVVEAIKQPPAPGSSGALRYAPTNDIQPLLRARRGTSEEEYRALTQTLFATSPET